MLNIKVGKTSINEWIAKFKEENNIDIDREGNCGRKHVIGLETGKKIATEMEENRDLTAKDIQRDNNLNHNQVSVQTINRYLEDIEILALSSN